MNTAESMGRLDLSSLIDKNRPILVFAPAEDDPRLALQRKALDDQRAGLADREVVVIEALEAASAALRSTYGIKPGEFAVVLLGKDGSEKERWPEPVAAQEIFGKIDAMPMRRQEVHERKFGDGRRVPGDQ